MSPTTLILGGDDPLTRLLVEGLARGDSTPRQEVVAVGGRPDDEDLQIPPAGHAIYLATSRACRRPKQGQLAQRSSGPDLDDVARVFEALELQGIGHLAVLSSSEAEEPSHHHPCQITEERAAPRCRGNRLTQRWLELEEMARAWQRGGAGDIGSVEEAGSKAAPLRRLTLLRPAPTVIPGGCDFWSRLLGRRAAWVPAGFDPTVQLLAPADLLAALIAILGEPEPRPSAPAIEAWNIAPRANLPLSKALSLAGVRRLPLPGLMQKPASHILASLDVGEPAARLDYLRYPFTVSGQKLSEHLGHRASASTAQVAAAMAARRGPNASRTGPSGPPIPGSAGKTRPGSAGKTRPGSAGKSEPGIDPYGLDVAYIERLSSRFFRFLHEAWWRIDARGVGNVPPVGGAVMAGVHRGHQPWDGVMAMYLLARERQRHVRFLTHPSLLKFPFLAPFMIKMGGVPATREAGDWVLEQGKILAIFPEGIRGAFRPYNREIYELGRFGRDDYVRFALRHRVPIVPFVTIGSAEIFPIFAQLRPSWWKRWTEWPSLPLTPTLGTIPLPSKWHTRFLEPIPTEQEAEDAESDTKTVRELGRLIKDRMQSALDDLLRRRRRIFWGDLAEGTERSNESPRQAAQEAPRQEATQRDRKR